MERYLGIDVHRDSSTICVLDASGRQKHRDVVETQGSSLVRYVGQLSGSLHVCLEESCWSEWLYEILSPHVKRIVVYQSVWSPGVKSDAVDARALAEKLRTGSIRSPVFKSPHRFRKLRELVRVYQMLSQDVVRTQCRLRSLYRRRGVCCSGQGIYSPHTRTSWVEKLPTDLRPAAILLGTELDELRELKQEAQGSMVAEASRYKIARILGTAPGLGPVRVAQLMAIVVTPHRFRTKRQFWSYCGFAVVTRSSSDWTRIHGQWVRDRVAHTRGLNRNRNPTLKAIFKGAATTVLSRSGPNPLQVAYERLCDNGTKPNLAKLTIARKIAAITLAMWKAQEVYQPQS